MFSAQKASTYKIFSDKMYVLMKFLTAELLFFGAGTFILVAKASVNERSFIYFLPVPLVSAQRSSARYHIAVFSCSQFSWLLQVQVLFIVVSRGNFFLGSIFFLGSTCVCSKMIGFFLLFSSSIHLLV